MSRRFILRLFHFGGFYSCAEICAVIWLKKYKYEQNRGKVQFIVLFQRNKGTLLSTNIVKVIGIMLKVIKIILNVLIIAGALAFMVGLYYLMIKAGIPAQDPTPEMKAQYAQNMLIGDSLVLSGFLTSLTASIPRIIIGIVSRRRKQGSANNA